MRLVILGVLTAGAAAGAQSIAVTVMDAKGLGDGLVRRVHKAALEQLAATAGVRVADGFDWKGPKRACGDAELDCQREKVKATRASAALALWLSSERLRGELWLDGERSGPPREVELLTGSPEGAARAVVDGLLPMWMKKGWGAVQLPAEPRPGTVLKVDGRVLPATGHQGRIVAVTAGVHQLDVVSSNGRALLQRIEVAEGRRTAVELAPLEGLATAGATSRFSALRAVSYSAWMVGAATLLGAFVVAFLGRQTAVGQAPCQVDTRGCSTLDEALEKQRQAAGYASIANVLLVSGLVASVAGAGLFTLDALR